MLGIVCSSCGEQHEGQEIFKFLKRQGLATHWYRCPNTNEPVLLTMLEGSPDVPDALLKSLSEATTNGAYMVVAWWFRDGVPVMSRTTFEFPTNLFAGCVMQLQRNLQEENADSFGVKSDQVVQPEMSVNLFA